MEVEQLEGVGQKLDILTSSALIFGKDLKIHSIESVI